MGSTVCKRAIKATKSPRNLFQCRPMHMLDKHTHRPFQLSYQDRALSATPHLLKWGQGLLKSWLRCQCKVCFQCWQLKQVDSCKDCILLNKQHKYTSDSPSLDMRLIQISCLHLLMACICVRRLCPICCGCLITWPCLLNSLRDLERCGQELKAGSVAVTTKEAMNPAERPWICTWHPSSMRPKRLNTGWLSNS